ncbi:uncharacterized protein [Periplaneta americana]|uniref:uncharacterized protein n=1 Tax=Periplaneta americana TaxID=6978 RepID=UPI0037E864D1
MKCQRGVVLSLAAAALLLVALSEAADPPKSAFGEAFDEIVVESTLTVRGKGGARQSRTKPLSLKSTSTSTTTTTTEGTTSEEPKRSKREKSEFHGPRASNPHYAARAFQVVDLFGRDIVSPGELLGEKRP